MSRLRFVYNFIQQLKIQVHINDPKNECLRRLLQKQIR